MANGTTKTSTKPYPRLKLKERLSIWNKAKGIWKKRKPDPIKELEKMRSEW